MSAQVTGRGNTAKISVTTAGAEDSQVSLMVEMAGRVTNYELTQEAPGIYTATFDTAKPGIYELLVTQADRNGDPLNYWDTAITVSYLGEYDVFAAEGRTLLNTLCGYTGGKLYTNMQALADVQVGSVQNSYNPMAVFAALVSRAFLGRNGTYGAQKFALSCHSFVCSGNGHRHACVVRAQQNALEVHKARRAFRNEYPDDESRYSNGRFYDAFVRCGYVDAVFADQVWQNNDAHSAHDVLLAVRYPFHYA